MISRRGSWKGIAPKTVARRAQLLLDALGLTAGELSVVLCDDRAIAELNREYRGEDRPTDVLSFSLLEDAPSGAPEGGAIPIDPPALLGDVVISVETAARQAERLGRPLVDEISALLVHGILHILGHDHDTAADRKKMDAEASRIEQILASALARGKGQKKQVLRASGCE